MCDADQRTVSSMFSADMLVSGANVVKSIGCACLSLLILIE